MTERNFKAVVKEGTATPFLALEPMKTLPDYSTGLIMQLKPGTTYDEAAELARAINERTVSIQTMR